MAHDDRAVRELVDRIEGLLGELDALPESPARSVALDALQALVRLYGEGLARIADLVAGATDPSLPRAFASDELIAHLLLLHDLHPVAVDERVRRALDEVRPYLHSHGGNVELLGVEGGIAHLRLDGSCHGCRSSSQTLRTAVEEAVLRAAPELERVEADGVAEPDDPAPVPLVTLRRSEARR